MTVEKKETRFDFSQYDLYKKCPQSYFWKYVERRVPKTPPNLYYALPGIAIQKIFEHFYNDCWYLKRTSCREFMYGKAPEIFENTLKYLTVDWQSKIAKKTKQQVFDEYLEMVGRNLDVIKEKKLLGSLAKSEFKIQSYFENNKYVLLTSKVDFLLKTSNEGTMILDGKATSNKNNYLKNPAQLYFYAMVYKFKYKVYPDRIGYWFWRTGEIVFVDFDDAIIEALKEDIKDVLYKIYKKKFVATPDYSTCLFCNYQEECFERKKHSAEKSAEKNVTVTQNDLDAFL